MDSIRRNSLINTMSRIPIITTSLLLVFLCACERFDVPQEPEPTDMVFTVMSVPMDSDLRTKAEAVTTSSLSSLKVTATRGEAGSETLYFGNKVFFRDGRWYKADVCWPTLDPNLHFYGSNVDMVFDADGTYINVSNADDVVTCTLFSPNINAPNAMAMKHVLSRIHKITTVCTDGCEISDVCVRIIPKTGGKYNMRTDEWSNLVTGTSVTLSGTTLGTRENDLCLVPGTYFLMASWTARKNGISKSYIDVSSRIVLSAGKSHNITVRLGNLE